MNISSKFHTQPGKVQLLVLDVLADGKPFLAGVVIGGLKNGVPSSSELGGECLRRLTAAQDASSNSNTVRLVEVLSPPRASVQVSKVCAAVDRHDAVAFFCINNETYEAVFRALNIGA